MLKDWFKNWRTELERIIKDPEAEKSPLEVVHFNKGQFFKFVFAVLCLAGAYGLWFYISWWSIAVGIFLYFGLGVLLMQLGILK